MRKNLSLPGAYLRRCVLQCPAYGQAHLECGARIPLPLSKTSQEQCCRNTKSNAVPRECRHGMAYPVTKYCGYLEKTTSA